MNIFRKRKISKDDVLIKTGKNNKDSIYNRIISAEEKGNLSELNLEEYLVAKSQDKDINLLVRAFSDYYNKDYNSIEEFYNYFRQHRAEDIIDRFETYIFSLEIFNEQKMVGLSILLMRDTESIEAIKFGMLLSKFYSLESAPGAMKLITDLGIYPEFTKLSLELLKQVRFYDVLRDNILRRGNDKVKEIERNIK